MINRWYALFIISLKFQLLFLNALFFMQLYSKHLLFVKLLIWPNEVAWLNFWNYVSIAKILHNFSNVFCGNEEVSSNLMSCIFMMKWEIKQRREMMQSHELYLHNEAEEPHSLKEIKFQQIIFCLSSGNSAFKTAWCIFERWWSISQKECDWRCF